MQGGQDSTTGCDRLRGVQETLQPSDMGTWRRNLRRKELEESNGSLAEWTVRALGLDPEGNGSEPEPLETAQVSFQTTVLLSQERSWAAVCTSLTPQVWMSAEPHPLAMAYFEVTEDEEDLPKPNFLPHRGRSHLAHRLLGTFIFSLAEWICFSFHLFLFVSHTWQCSGVNLCT